MSALRGLKTVCTALLMLSSLLTRTASKPSYLFTAAFSVVPSSFRANNGYMSRRLLSSKNSVGDLSMDNLYEEWSLEEDRLLWEHRKESIPELAALLGRGLGGVESRLVKLNNRDSPAYQRLFSGDSTSTSNKLAPAGEVLRRIQWDDSLIEGDFSVKYYDRVDDALVESPMDAPNTSVAGKEERFVFAIPEHRIMMILYKERVVWDREGRIDRVFGSSMRGNGETIDSVMAGYDEWKRQKDLEEQLNRQRQEQVSSRIERMLGFERFAVLKDFSSSLLHNEDISEVESYVQKVLQLFRDARNDPESSLEPTWIPSTDAEALDTFSELAALLPKHSLRSAILNEIVSLLPKDKQQESLQNYQLPELVEEELTETFVRGSGAGGQKVNQTSNRVLLVHEPTQLRVECQETRSLQQNRKIARKRLRLKLDEYLHGNQSKASRQADKRKSKKSKAKARNRARQRKKKAMKAAAEDV